MVRKEVTMSNIIPGNNKHLSLIDRQYIEACLRENTSFKDIARFLCKDPTTISKEVKLHRMDDIHPKRIFNNPHNFCTRRFRCKRTNVCNKIIICEGKCPSCRLCNQHCKDFKKEECNRLSKAPYVCNGCSKAKHLCTVPHKYRYCAAFAQRTYEELRSSSRKGVNMTKHEALKMNEVVSPLIRQGQSPYQVLTNHPELAISVKTLYNYIDKGVLLSRNIDLKRKAKFKPRKHTRKGIRDREVFVGRTYQDFKALAPDDFMEMDTVLSARGSSKCILTFYNPETELLIARLLPRCTERSVKAVFDRLEHSLGTYDFLSVFEICLTDRGSEFGDPVLLETGVSGIQRCSIYYCDPMRSGQKGGIEQVHTMLRMIIPKGTVFTDLTQWDVRKAVDHINSTPRANLSGQTPYQLAIDKYGARIVRFMLQLRYVAPDEVTLTPELLQK